MNSLSIALWIYALTIVFALLIALVIRGMAAFIHILGSERDEDQLDLSIPSANSAREEEALAVAIAVAHAQRK